MIVTRTIAALKADKLENSFRTGEIEISDSDVVTWADSNETLNMVDLVTLGIRGFLTLRMIKATVDATEQV